MHVINCKSEEAEFLSGLRLLTSLRHENLAKLCGFCCSMSRGACYLIFLFEFYSRFLCYLDVKIHAIESDSRFSVYRCDLVENLGF